MRRQRVHRFVVVLVLIFPGKIFSQQVSPRIAQISPHGSQVFCCSSSKKPVEHFSLIDQDEFLWLKNSRILPLADRSERITPLTVERFAYSNCYLSHLGFFCQKENQFERNTSVPLRLRLGSLAYVDKLEGKK